MAQRPTRATTSNGPRLFAEVERLLEQPNGLKQLFEEFGRRAVCDAIMCEEPPFNSSTIADFQASLKGFLSDHPQLADRKFEMSMKILPAEDKPTNNPFNTH